MYSISNFSPGNERRRKMKNTRENKYDEHKKRYSTQHTALSANILIG